MSEVAITNFADAVEEWRAYSSPADVREFFLRIARSLVHLWKARAFSTLDEQLRALTQFADRVPELSSDEWVRSYARGAIDVLLEQGSEILNVASSPTERTISGDVGFGKNHLAVIAKLYDRPLRVSEIHKETGLDTSYLNRVLKKLEHANVVQRVGKGYGLTAA